MSALEHVTSVEEVAWGIVLVAVTMTIHAFAMPVTFAACTRVRKRFEDRHGFFAGVRVLLLAAVLLALAQRFQDEQLRRLDVPLDDAGS